MRRSDTSRLRALGAGPMAPTRDLEIIALDTPAPIAITFTSSELLALCPVTTQRDHYDATIGLCSTATLESKSLKLYLASWEQEEMLAEDLTNTIADDVSAALGDHATSVEVELRQHVRGGLDITVVASRPS